jgi:hypothetical protein
MAAPTMAGETVAPPPPLPPPPPSASTAQQHQLQRPGRDNPPPPPPALLVPPPYDPALDPAIKQLLDQQADIQAKLAQLLPQKYGPNIKVELEMLRHKLRVLETYANDNRELLSLSSRRLITSPGFALRPLPALSSMSLLPLIANLTVCRCIVRDMCV